MAAKCTIVEERQEFKKGWKNIWAKINTIVKETLGIHEKSGDLLTYSSVMWPQISSYYQQVKSAISIDNIDHTQNNIDTANRILDSIESITNDQVNYTNLWTSWTYFNDILLWIERIRKSISWDKISSEANAKWFLNGIREWSVLNNPITLYTQFAANKVKELYAETFTDSQSYWDSIFWTSTRLIPWKTREKILYVLSSTNSAVRKWANLYLGRWASLRRWIDKFTTLWAVSSLSRHLWPLALLSVSAPMVFTAYWVMFAPSLFRVLNLMKRNMNITGKDAKRFAKQYWLIWWSSWSFRNWLRTKWIQMLNWVGIDNILLTDTYMKEAVKTIWDREWKSVDQLSKDMEESIDYKNQIFNAIYETYAWYSWQEVYKWSETQLTALWRLTSIMSKFGMVNLKYWLRALLWGKTIGKKIYANALESQSPNTQEYYLWYANNNLDVTFFYNELFQWLARAFKLARIADDMDDDDDDAEDNLWDTLVNTPSILTNNATFMAFAQSNVRLRLVYSWLETVAKNMWFLLDENDININTAAANVWVSPASLRTWAYVKTFLDQLFFRAAQPFVSIAQAHNAYKSSWSKEQAFEALASSYFWAMSNFINETDWLYDDLWFETPLWDKWLMYLITGKRFDESYDIVNASKQWLWQWTLSNNWWLMASLMYWLEKSKLFQSFDYWDIDAPTNLKDFAKATSKDQVVMKAVAEWDISWLSIEALNYAYNQYSKLDYDWLKNWLSVDDWKLINTYKNKYTWEIEFSDQWKKLLAFQEYLNTKVWKDTAEKIEKNLQDIWNKSPEDQKSYKAYLQNLITQSVAKEEWAANSALMFAAFLEVAKDAAYRKEWYIHSSWKTLYESQIPTEAQARIKAQLMKDYWWIARLVDADNFTSTIVYEVANKNPELRSSVKWFVPWIENSKSKVELNYDKYDAMYDSFLIWVNDLSNWKLDWIWYLTTMSSRYYDLLSKYPKQKAEIQQWMLENILVMKNYYSERWVSDKAIVNATVPFFMNNQEVLVDYLKNDNIDQNDKDQVMNEIYDIYDKVDLVSQLPEIKKNLEESSWKSSWYYSGRNYKSFYQSYMDDIGDNLPFKNLYNNFKNYYNKNLSYASDTYAKKIYAQWWWAKYNQQERKFLNARAYYKPAFSQYPVDERFWPTSWWFNTYIKQQQKFKPSISWELTLFPTRASKKWWPIIWKSRSVILKKSRIYNSNASSATKAR